jgi:outer membrane protein assembly factor BamB
LTVTIACVRTSATDLMPEVFPTLILGSIDLPAQPSSSPVAAGDVVALPLQSGEIAAWRLSDRTLAWTATLAAQGPLAAAGDRIVVQTKEGIVALSASTGKPVWNVTVAPLTAPILARAGWVVVATGEEVATFRLADGVKVWGQSFGQVEQRPTIEGDRLYVPIVDGRVLAVDLETGILRWTRQLGGSPTEVLALADRVYLGAGSNFVCLRARDGVESWRWDKIGAPIVGAPAADADNVYMTAMDNLLRAMDRGSGNNRWKADLGHRPEAGPVVIGTTVAVPGRAAGIRGFHTSTGRPAVQLALPDQMVVQPVFFTGPEGRQLIAAVTANLKGENRLTVAGSVTPFLPITPLTTLPGTPITMPAPTSAVKMNGQ